MGRISIFGSYARGCFRPRHAFVDKACIQQSDDEQKRRGILALAGFLKSSDRLVMLWTTRYFTRLWCVFEVVVWLNIGRELKFVPVSSALFCIFGQSCCFLCVTLMSLGRVMGMSFVTVLFPCVLLSSFVCISVCRWILREVMTLPTQLSTFSMRECGCFLLQQQSCSSSEWGGSALRQAAHLHGADEVVQQRSWTL